MYARESEKGKLDLNAIMAGLPLFLSSRGYQGISKSETAPAKVGSK